MAAKKYLIRYINGKDYYIDEFCITNEFTQVNKETYDYLKDNENFEVKE